MGGTILKDRITVLLLLIWKEQKKEAISNLPIKKFKKLLPVTYIDNKLTWMTSQLFEEELRKCGVNFFFHYD